MCNRVKQARIRSRYLRIVILVPLDAYYGVQSLRAAENFPITGLNMHLEIVNSIVYIKKAAAITHNETRRLSKEKADAIIKACDEILEGHFLDNFNGS